MPKKGYQDIKEEVFVKRTGKNFEDWQKILDRFDVKKNGRSAAVRFLKKVYKVNAWWSHVVVIRYEFEKNIVR